MSTTREFTIEKNMVKNYMGYGMYVITDRALPKVEDGFLPVQRKILYAMKQKGFTYDKDYAKTLDIIGSTTPFYVHGDSSLAGAMSLLVDTNETQRTPYIEGHGNFGNVLSAGSYSAPRYTSARLSELSEETLFTYLDKNGVKMVGEEDHKEPLFLPVSYPNILTINITGVAVGMACNFHGYALKDVCEYTSKYILDRSLMASDYLIPDFNDTCELIYNKGNINSIADTGRGSVKLRGKYYTTITEQGITLSIYVPYGTTAKGLTDEITSKLDKFKEITDVRNGTGFNKEKKKEEYIVDIDVRKGTDIKTLVNKLYKYTKLETSISYNMNCLVNFTPKVRGVNEILDSWILTREECIKKGLQFDLNKKIVRLHLLQGYRKIFLDIDKAIDIIKNTKEESLINQSLMDYFNIDLEQSEAVSNLKLRNINKKYIANQIKALECLESEIKDLEYKINHKEAIDEMIISDLQYVKKKFCKPRQTEIIQESYIEQLNDNELIEQYNCRLVYTQQGYIKKHLKQSDSHKIKDDDIILGDVTTNNTDTLLIFTDKANRYKISCHELNTYTPSQLGDYVYNITTMDKDEKIIKIVSIPREYNKNSYIICTFENGNVSKVSAEQFLSNNKKLQNCYNTESKLLNIEYVTKDVDVLMVSSEGKGLIYSIVKCNPKQSRNTKGVRGMKVSDDVKIIGSIIDVNQDYNFRLTTEKQKIIDKMLNDVVSNSDDRQLYSYLRTSTIATQGNFIYNTRSTNDTITKFELI